MAAKQQTVPGAAALVLGAESRALRLKVRAGDEAVTRVLVTNSGQSALVLDRSGTVPLRRADALARCVRTAFKEQPGDLITRLIALGKRLQEEPAATAAITYKAPFEALQPGQTAEVEIRLRIPEDVGAETGWTARLPVLGTTVAAELEIAADRTTSAPSRTEPRRRSRPRKGDDA
jgi:hypothetical protein